MWGFSQCSMWRPQRWRFICIWFNCLQTQSNSSLCHIAPTIETLFIETVNENYNLLIVSIYRPLSDNAIILLIDKLYELLSFISRNGNDEIFCAMIPICIFLTMIITKTYWTFFNSLMSQSLIVIIAKPSRVTDQTATLIHNIFSTQSNKFVSGILISDVPDHLPLFILKRNLSTKHKCEILSNRWLDHNSY